MAALGLLPSEMVSHVCRFLEKEDLLSFCRVSKWVAEQVRPHLYQDIALWSERITSFLRTTITHPQLAHFVRYLRISSFKPCAVEKKDTEFFRNHLVGTGTHADIF